METIIITIIVGSATLLYRWLKPILYAVYQRSKLEAIRNRLIRGILRSKVKYK